VQGVGLAGVELQDLLIHLFGLRQPARLVVANGLPE
jgi:hypothetical protein